MSSKSDDSGFLVSFGRRRGRKLRRSREELFESLLPRLALCLPEKATDPAEWFGRSDGEVWFELGFGGGEHLLAQAQAHPQHRFIGCEPYVNGMSSLLVALAEHPADNVRLYTEDARPLLEKMPEASIDRMFVLFPDPWPKTRHHKRRIISQEGLALFYSRIKPGGRLRLATDHVDYGHWMLEQILLFGRFRWLAQRAADWRTPPADWVRTRYQAKAEAEGRAALFLELERPR